MTEIKFSTGGNCEFFCSKKPGDFSLNSEISLKKKKKKKKKQIPANFPTSSVSVNINFSAYFWFVWYLIQAIFCSWKICCITGICGLWGCCISWRMMLSIYSLWTYKLSNSLLCEDSWLWFSWISFFPHGDGIGFFH